MYEYLEGKVAQRTAARLVLDVNGVGYDLLAPLAASFPEVGQRSRVYVHMVVREDAHIFYGFPSSDDRDLFRLLLRARGVGPGIALAVLSGLSREDLVRAVLDEDPKPLQRVKGVGKKTADQMLLDLRDKAAELAGGRRELMTSHAALTPFTPPDPAEVNAADAIAALMSIGFTDKEAKKQVDRARETVDANDLEALVRAAIQG
ncbi:MAG: Holliday junction branch migration protein RuvA [Planctomycetota bacterium]